MRLAVFIFIAFVLLCFPVLAQEISNPQIVSSASVEITQTGHITSSGADQIELKLYIPQQDSFQNVESISVSAKEWGYEIDQWGNKILKISWQNPVESIDFQVKTIVSIKRREAEAKLGDEFLLPSPLVESASPTIISLAERVASGSDDFSRISSLVKWVNQNIEYDKSYEYVNLSALQTLIIKKGTCDEFSNLLIALTRAIGYTSAYIAGFAFSKSWEPHSWVNINGIVADPTWAEAGFIDASHIKFATLPDGLYTEAKISAKGKQGLSVNLGEINTEIKILDFNEQPLIDTKASLVEKNVKEGYAVLRGDFSFDGCVLTKVKAQSCVAEGKEFLTPLVPEQIIYFCRTKSVFEIFKAPLLDSSMIYNCELRIWPYAGESKADNLTLSPTAQTADAKLSVDKTSVIPGERISVSAESSHIFTDYGDYGFSTAKFTAPESDFKIYAYKYGSLAEQEVYVTKTRPIEFELFVNDTLMLGKSAYVLVKVENILEKTQLITVKIGNQSQTKTLGAGLTETFNLTFTPKNLEDNLIQIFITADGFLTSSSKIINIIAPEKSWLEKIFNIIRNLFNYILSLVGIK